MTAQPFFQCQFSFIFPSDHIYYLSCFKYLSKYFKCITLAYIYLIVTSNSYSMITPSTKLKYPLKENSSDFRCCKFYIPFCQSQLINESPSQCSKQLFLTRGTFLSFIYLNESNLSYQVLGNLILTCLQKYTKIKFISTTKFHSNLLA